MLLFAIVGLLHCNYSFSQSAEYDYASGLYYKSVSGGFAVTTKNTSQSPYTGDIVVPDNVRPGTRMFYGKVIGIDNLAFHKSTITSISLPSTLLSIGDNAFVDCKNLSQINLPSSVNTIGKYAFSGMTKITTFTIPNSVTSIDYRILDGCSSLQTVYSTIKEPDGIIHRATFEGIPSGVTLYVPYGTKSKYTSLSSWKDYFKEIKEYYITHTLLITTSGGGSVTYKSTAVRDMTQTFTVNEGTSATITLTPDAGYRVSSVILNGNDITSNIVNNEYTISNINAKTTLYVIFEAITHTLSITASGSGSATFNSTAVRDKTSAFTINEGSSATISFDPDTGYRIAKLTLNGKDVTSSVVSNKYTISKITANTTLLVTFEVITHTLSLTAYGNGSVTYNGTTIRDKTQSFNINEGVSPTITFTPDTDYRIASVMVNGTDVTANVVNNKYTINNFSTNTTLTVQFEIITHTLSITAFGNGSATYTNKSVREETQNFSLNQGSSATIVFTPDARCMVASVKVNNADVTANVINGQYTISNITTNTTLTVTFEMIRYALSITSSGNGYVAYDGNTIRGKTQSFSVVEGTSAILKFSADSGNRLKSVKVDGQDVTSTVTNNQYTISNVRANTSIEVAFEQIPNYTMNIVVSGNGSAAYNGTTIRNQSQSFTLQEGSSAVISFTPDTGYRIKSIKVNNTDVSSQVANGQITVSNIMQNTNVEVAFEAIPPTTYSLTISATGNGIVTFDGKSVRAGTQTFSVVEGSFVTIQITADDGYRIKQVTLDGEDVTDDVYDFTNSHMYVKVTANTSFAVTFEPIPTYTLTIRSTAFGAVKYGDDVVTNRTETFSVREGSQAVLTFTPDDNGRLQRIMLNDTDITNQLTNGQYTISYIRGDQSVVAEYVEDITKVTFAGVAYTVTSYDEGTVAVAAGNYGLTLKVPATFEAKGKTWRVTGLADDALKGNTQLGAIVWKPQVVFSAEVSNPNLLLYVTQSQYAPSGIQNVVVGDENEGEELHAENIVLTEAEDGNNFYCPLDFIARHISYEHNYSMLSGYKTCQGWETLVLPFDVSMIVNAKGTELVPRSTWSYGSSLRPFWIYQLTAQGWRAADGIKANTPYILCMPNNEMYDATYNQTGNIQYIGNNVEVKASDSMTTSQYGNKRLVANYQNQAASNAIYALNVSNDWYQNTATEAEGSTFIRSLRSVHPFEAYMTIEGSAPALIPIFDNATDVRWLMEDVRGTAEDAWYDLQGRKLQSEPKQKGIYIRNGKKVKY